MHFCKVKSVATVFLLPFLVHLHNFNDIVTKHNNHLYIQSTDNFRPPIQVSDWFHVFDTSSEQEVKMMKIQIL